MQPSKWWKAIRRWWALTNEQKEWPHPSEATKRPFVGLTLEEIEDIIQSNITITDQRLYEGVYAVAVDIEIALKNKNDRAEG